MDIAYCAAIGADVSDRTTKIRVMSKACGKPKIVHETTIPTTPDGFRAFLEHQDKAAALVFETGTHCRWIDKDASDMGFKTFVANPCRPRMITESTTKNDKNDARTLAHMALADIELLHPVKLRGDERQKMVNLHEIRDQLVKERTAEVLQIRRPRDIGPWLGVAPKQDQSGDIDRQCHITKTGSKMLRWKLTECAQRVVQKSSADIDLKVKGLMIRARGGKIAKGKSITAVARGLAVLMVAMLKKPDEPYVPRSRRGASCISAIRGTSAAMATAF